MTRWHDLESALDRCAAEGHGVTFWWRDDDAGRSMPALDQLLSLAARFGAPIGLAVIPTTLDDLALTRIMSEPLATPLLHGLAHHNNAQSGEKKSEFPASRSLELMRDDVRYGFHLLRAAFGGRALPVLVPPWNRLATALIPALPTIGIAGLSRYLARDAAMAAPMLRQVNCHVDLIDWQSTRGFIGEEAALRLVLANLDARRSGVADPGEPIGLLSHHQNHDDACWSFLEAFLACLARHKASRIIAPAELFPEACRAA